MKDFISEVLSQNLILTFYFENGNTVKCDGLVDLYDNIDNLIEVQYKSKTFLINLDHVSYIMSSDPTTSQSVSY